MDYTIHSNKNGILRLSFWGAMTYTNNKHIPHSKEAKHDQYLLESNIPNGSELVVANCISNIP